MIFDIFVWNISHVELNRNFVSHSDPITEFSCSTKYDVSFLSSVYNNIITFHQANLVYQYFYKQHESFHFASLIHSIAFDSDP
jgi:hypothetical protein